MSERFAIYYAPSVEHPLWWRAKQWMNGDAIEGQNALTKEAFFGHSQSARRYGFHATIVAPMRLASGISSNDLFNALTVFAREAEPVEIGSLEVRNLHGFLALMPAPQTAELSMFAAACVAKFQGLRAPLSEQERNKRLKSGLTQHQIGLLDQYGYPYVMDEFRMHMTLTDRLPADISETVQSICEEWFAPVLNASIWLDRLVVYREPEPGADFVREGDFPLTGTRERQAS